jgi:hypothetical protein
MMRQLARRIFLATTATAISLALLAAVVSADRSGNYVVAASGKASGHRWTLEAGRERGQRCFKLSLAAQTLGIATTCETPAEPPRLWSRIVGNSDETASVELDITAPRVSHLKLLLGHPGSRGPSTWWAGPTRSLNEAEASQAHLKANFRFVVLAGRGPNLCVEKVRAFDRDGRLLESLSVPCEY